MSIATAKIMDGKAVAQQVLDRCALRVKEIIAASGVTPCLATILVGDDPASATYVKMKGKRCEAVGMKSLRVEMPSSTTTAELIAKIRELGSSRSVHGILLQHPVPHHIDERAAFEAIPGEKDVDGVTIQSFGVISFGLPTGGYGSCTPAGIMRLLDAYQINPAGKQAVVIGRSPILGKPMAMMLLARDATVTICHSKTRNLPEIVRQGDIVVAAVGRARFVQGEWIKQGSVVIDAGYSEGNIGDVDFDSAAARASLITPVPGGVGPMTIATLIDQTAIAAARQLKISPAASASL
ncbi:MAG: bifunctional 5,10-methylene-tetrahydrofolate dehydrogenase/5,10-methylene-tetrahydrofolate cyclohydrolase [Phycisphaeraceae bacterium]|nr:bifunctional 5,10-methylene-tetrahydrofolate dehydrogenase/5,10-methylene-tetrahydrofolate cyclohydrolase [Phycisphaeraceae bacterium]